MNKFVRSMQTYLLYAFPFVLLVMLWGTLNPDGAMDKDRALILRMAWEVLSWNLIIWFSTLVSFLILLVAIPDVREKTLKRLANLKDRDEREEYITGKASRASYVSTLSLLILFLFLSIFTVNVHRVPEEQAIDGKRGAISIGLQFNLLDRSVVQNQPAEEVLFETKDVPLSKTAILLVLIAWQVGVFNFAARKENLGISGE